MSTEVTTSASSSSEKLPEFEPPLASINRLIKAVRLYELFRLLFLLLTQLLS